jgi:3-isopropylmalate dehydratase small subunit
VELDEMILTGRAWVVKGALSGEAVIAGVAHGTCGGAGDWLLVTGMAGTGERAAQAVTALQQHGLRGVIAPAFAWQFFRVCLNLGLPPLTVWEAEEIRHGDRLRVALTGQVVKNLSSGRRYPIRNLSDLYLAILACGGMPGYVQALRTGHEGPC